MEYAEMIESAKQKGIATEKKMWQAVKSISKVLDSLKESHEELYWRVMREQHGIIHNNHYTEEFAEYDVKCFEYEDKFGNKLNGSHWTRQQIEDATDGQDFPNGTTTCDKYVAYNAMYADLCKKFDEQQIMDAAYLFFFADSDWPSCTKIWEYMSARIAIATD